MPYSNCAALCTCSTVQIDDIIAKLLVDGIDRFPMSSIRRLRIVLFLGKSMS